MTTGWAKELPLCLYVSSYHSGYEWNDGIESGLQTSIHGRCRLERFYMDTKRNKSPDFAKAQALKAKKLIETQKPDVVIACDDNASIYLVMPYLKNTDVPVVFCGINWTIKPYGYPYPNVTGMIEIAPLQAVLNEAVALLPKAKRVGFLTANVISQRKDAQRLRKMAKTLELKLEEVFVDNMQVWQTAFKDLQQRTDILIVGNTAGINGWDMASAIQFVDTETRNLTVSFSTSTYSLVVFAMVHYSQEQGWWAGKTAVRIINGTAPSEIPITKNHHWRVYSNLHLAKKAGIHLSSRLLKTAKPAR